MAISDSVCSVPFYEPFRGFPFRSSMHGKPFPVLLFCSMERVKIRSVPFLDIPCYCSYDLLARALVPEEEQQVFLKGAQLSGTRTGPCQAPFCSYFWRRAAGCEGALFLTSCSCGRTLAVYNTHI